MKDRYLQFPISALGIDLAENGRALLGLACHHYGSKWLEKEPLPNCMTIARDWCDRHPEIQADISGPGDQLALVLGFYGLSITPTERRLSRPWRMWKPFAGYALPVLFLP